MATFDITKVDGSEIEDGKRAAFTGSVSWQDHIGHTGDGEPLFEQKKDEDGNEMSDENGIVYDTDKPVMLNFDVDVYMPTDESERETAMQAYTDDYEAGYWASVDNGNKNS